MMLRALALALLMSWPASASAQEWQLKPFLGLTFAGETTIIDLDEAADDVHVALGGSVSRIGELVGFEADFGYVPGFLTGDRRAVPSSSVLTLTGNVVIALPRRMTQYTLRPYVAGGVGLMRVSKDDVFAVFPVTLNVVTIDVGGGATGFLSETVGLNWDIRYFRNITGSTDPDNPGLSFGAPHLSFWRLTMGLVLR
jgi:Outer membrane protein beta-barrel domain